MCWSLPAQHLASRLHPTCPTGSVSPHPPAPETFCFLLIWSRLVFFFSLRSDTRLALCISFLIGLLLDQLQKKSHVQSFSCFVLHLCEQEWNVQEQKCFLIPVLSMEISWAVQRQSLGGNKGQTFFTCICWFVSSSVHLSARSGNNLLILTKPWLRGVTRAEGEPLDTLIEYKTFLWPWWRAALYRALLVRYLSPYYWQEDYFFSM